MLKQTYVVTFLSQQLFQQISSFCKKIFVITCMSSNTNFPGTMVAYTSFSCWKNLFLGPWLLNTRFLYSYSLYKFPTWSPVSVSPLKETYCSITLAPYAASKFSIAWFKLLTYYVVDVDDINVFFLNDLPLYIVCMYVCMFVMLLTESFF